MKLTTRLFHRLTNLIVTCVTKEDPSGTKRHVLFRGFQRVRSSGNFKDIRRLNNRRLSRLNFTCTNKTSRGGTNKTTTKASLRPTTTSNHNRNNSDLLLTSSLNSRNIFRVYRTARLTFLRLNNKSTNPRLSSFNRYLLNSQNNNNHLASKNHLLLNLRRRDANINRALMISFLNNRNNLLLNIRPNLFNLRTNMFYNLLVLRNDNDANLIRRIGNLIQRVTINSVPLEWTRYTTRRHVKCHRAIVFLVMKDCSLRGHGNNFRKELLRHRQLRTTLRNDILFGILTMLIRNNNTGRLTFTRK